MTTQISNVSLFSSCNSFYSQFTIKDKGAKLCGQKWQKRKQVENEKEWNGMSHAKSFYNEWKQDQDKGIQHTFTAEEVVLVS